MQFEYALAGPFLEALNNGRLSLPKCSDCGRFHWQPMERCPYCRSAAVTWMDINPQGVIYTHSTVHHRFGRDSSRDVPYTVALIEFPSAPGVRLIAEMANSDPISIGTLVEPVFETDAGNPRVLFSAVKRERSVGARAATIYDALQQTAERFAENAAMAVPARVGRDYYPNGAEWTYREVHDMAVMFSRKFENAGYGIGHRIALLLDSRPEMVVAMYALNRLGVSIVPINPDYRLDETVHVLGHSEADLIVTLDKHAARIAEAASKLAVHPGVFILDRDSGLPPTPRRPKSEGTPDENTEAAILYTSGTTALPKGCVATNAYAIYAGERYINAGGILEISEGKERLFNPLPLFYVNSLMITTMAMVLSGGCHIYPDRFHARTWWADLAATKPTIMQYLGIVLPALLALPITDDERHHTLRIAVGAGIDPTLHETVQQRFGIPVVEVWGMTEVAIASVASQEPRLIGSRSIGHPCVGMEFAVLGEAGEKLPPGHTGELAVRRSGDDPRQGLIGEYLKDPTATAQAWRNGWFHTGDLATKQPDGSYCFAGRAKDIIRRSGQNIAASEVEAVLASHPAVALAACVAAPDEFREEEVFACIVPKSGPPSRALADEIVTWASQRLAYFKIPGWVAFFETLPVTATQKIRKRSIFAEGEDPRKSPGAFDMRERKRPIST